MLYEYDGQSRLMSLYDVQGCGHAVDDVAGTSVGEDVPVGDEMGVVRPRGEPALAVVAAPPRKRPRRQARSPVLARPSRGRGSRGRRGKRRRGASSRWGRF